MDYGTGHETSFALFLFCLMLVRFLQPEPKEERDIVLSIFLRYLRLCWKLQDIYRLEPAGSHGVWGLDDYCFLPYIFGSGQLRGKFLVINLSTRSLRLFLMITTDQTEIAVSAAVHPPLPSTNLYFMAIMRILDVKTGPFYEHSSQLHSIAVGVPNWGKVNSGLFKMYQVSTLLDCGLHIFYSAFNAAGGGVRETSCRTAYSVRGFVGVGAQRSRTSWNWASDDRAMGIYSCPDFKHATTINVDSGIGGVSK